MWIETMAGEMIWLETVEPRKAAGPGFFETVCAWLGFFMTEVV